MVNVTVDGFAEAVFPGTVSFIAPTATTNGSVRTYQVYVTLERQDGLRAGMNARVTISDAQ
jgi:HlyD family secretion protein